MVAEDAVAPEEVEAVSYSEYTKAELEAEAEARGLPTSGTKADLTARLEADDASEEVPPPGPPVPPALKK
jgi:beta-lactam-binding protein with PASTA domain